MGPIPRIDQVLTAAQLAALDERLRNPRNSYTAVRTWLAEQGCKISNEGVARYAHRHKLRPQRRARYLRVDKILPPAERLEYEALLADPRTTPGMAKAWLRARGHHASDPAVEKHRNRFLESVDHMRQAALEADALMRVTRASGHGVGLSEAAVINLERVLMEQISTYIENGGQVPPHQLVELGKSLSGVVGARDTIETMRRAYEENARKAAEAGAAAARAGASTKEIAERVRDILGA